MRLFWDRRNLRCHYSLAVLRGHPNRVDRKHQRSGRRRCECCDVWTTMGVHRADGTGNCPGDRRERPPQRWTNEHLDRGCPTDPLTGMRTIIEPFRIKSVEPLRYTTLEQRESYLQE